MSGKFEKLRWADMSDSEDESTSSYEEPDRKMSWADMCDDSDFEDEEVYRKEKDPEVGEVVKASADFNPTQEDVWAFPILFGLTA
mmetsp:Transcript_67192/g.179152  ORF Transcript_67192/g.179152 Transcript_67192/m.179152 type:complete len:85 (+) Transcript_67192:102-356(+)